MVNLLGDVCRVQSNLLYRLSIKPLQLNFIIMALAHDYQRSRLVDSSKLALLQYNVDSKPSSSHNYNQRSLFWDREHVYNQNLMLRNKIKQMEEINIKTRTRLLRSEKETAQIISRTKGKSQLNLMRSISTQQFKQDGQLTLLKCRVDSLKEEEHAKKIIFMKQQIRELKEEVQKMKNQNIELKKTMKYTRMTQLKAENNELMEEILRLKKLVSESSRQRDQMLTIFAKEKEDYRLNLRKEMEDQAYLKKELKKVKQNLNHHLKEQQTSGNKWIAQIKKLEFENLRLKEELKTSYNKTLESQPFTFKKRQRQEIGNPQNGLALVTETISTELMHKSLPFSKPEQTEPTSLEMLPKQNISEVIAPIRPKSHPKTPSEHEAIFEVAIQESRSHEQENRVQTIETKQTEYNIVSPKQQRNAENQREGKEELHFIQKVQSLKPEPQDNMTPVATIKTKQVNSKSPGQLLQQIYENDEEEFQNLMQEEIVEG